MALMKNKYVGYISSCLIAINALFLILYAAARQFAADGSLLQQGYIGSQGNINLSNIAVVAVFILIVTLIINRLLSPKHDERARLVRKMGLTVLLLIAAWFLFVAVVVVYGILSGHLLDGWQF